MKKLAVIMLAMFIGHALGLVAHNAYAQRRAPRKSRQLTVKACTPSVTYNGTTYATDVTGSIDSVQMLFRTNCSSGSSNNCTVTYNKAIFRYTGDANEPWPLVRGSNTCSSKTIDCGGTTLQSVGQTGLAWWEPGTYAISGWVDSGTCAMHGSNLNIHYEYFQL